MPCSFSLEPPDGEAKPGMAARAARGRVRYRGTMAADTPQALAAWVKLLNDTRLAYMVRRLL